MVSLKQWRKSNDIAPEPPPKKHIQKIERQLVALVNPRLALYTRAGFLAAIILILNYALVAVLSVMLMQVCTTSTTVEHSQPTTAGDFNVYRGFLNDTVAREGVVSADGVTITTTISGCAKRSVQMITAPHRRDIGAQASPWGPQATAPDPKYAGTGMVVEVPCWNIYIPCWAGRRAFDGNFANQSVDNMPCSFYSGKAASGMSTSDYFVHMATVADRFPWCSHEEETDARTRYLGMGSLTSDVFNGTVDLQMMCGSSLYVAPGGVLNTELYPGAKGASVTPGSTITPFTTYWNLNVTTTTQTCPTFAAAFANAFAFAAQIEIAITMALVFTLKAAGIVKQSDDMVDLGDQGILSKASARELAAAVTSAEA